MIEVEATESVLVDNSLLSVNTTASGDAGTIHVASPEVTFRGGRSTPGPDWGDTPSRNEAGASAETSAAGAGGTIEIEAATLVVEEASNLSANSYGENATGNAGSIALTVDSLRISAGFGVRAMAWGSGGNGGHISVEADSVLLGGGVRRSGLIVESRSYSTGNAGTIDLTARSLELVARGRISAGTYTGSSGDGGHISVEADSALVDATGLGAAGILVNSAYDSTGNAGTIDLTARSLELVAGGELSANTAIGSSGNGGHISVEADSVELIRGGVITAGTYDLRSGNAGTICIEADSVLISEPDPNGTGIFVPSLSGSSGNAGTIHLDVGDLVVASGGGIGASAAGGSTGNAGTILIDVGDLVVASGGGIDANAAVRAGNGKIDIDADTVHVGPHPDFPTAVRPIPGSSISASSFGGGQAGTISINATDSILVTYERVRAFDLSRLTTRLRRGDPALLSGIFSATLGEGGGGDISLHAPDITVTEGGIVATSSIAGGDAGSIELDGARIRVLIGGLVDSTSVFDNLGGGRRDGAAGSVTLTASESIEVAGRREVRRGGVPVEDWSRVSSASIGMGAAGMVKLVAPQVVIDEGAVATTALPDFFDTDAERGGAIEIAADELIVRGGGRIDASTFVAGRGGSIAITGIDGRPASDSILVEGAGSGIASRTGAPGPGGDVSLAARRIEVRAGGEVESRSGPGLDEIREIFPGSTVGEPGEATGNAGSVTLTANELRLFRGTLAVNSEKADGGNLTVEAKELVHLDAGEITASVNDGGGGNITIDPEVVILQNGSLIEARAGDGTGGTIAITADNYFAFPGTVVSADADDPDLSGTVEVNTPDVNLAGALAELPSNPLDAASQMKEPCAARRSGERAGSFAVRAAEGIPPEPDGWLPATVGAGGGAVPAARGELGTAGSTLLTAAVCR
jgi:hypothetical protein